MRPMMMIRGMAAAAVVSGVALAACGTDSREYEEVQRVATWYGGIQPLLVEKCGGCHTAGGAGPFPLDDYDSAYEQAGRALEAVETNVMPPWGAHDTDECAPSRPWKDDLRLTDEDKALLREWVAAGEPLGDKATALPVPQAPSLELTDATVSRSFQQPFSVPPADHDQYECFVLDPGISEAAWVTGVQVTAGNTRIAHHALVFLDNGAQSEALATDGHFPCFSNPDIDVSLIAAWAPGAVPTTLPENSGMPIKPGARIVVQMHYHPYGQTEVDQSSVALRLTSDRPDYEAMIALLGNFDSHNMSKGTGLMPGAGDGGSPEFLIPAGARGHMETMVYKQLDVPIAVPVFAVANHMHYVGVDMKIEHTFSNTSADDRECLLQTPRWDFNWQRMYNYDVPIDDMPTIRPGDELIMRCTYDNSMENEFVKDALAERGLPAPIDVRLGEQTLDEMCLGVFGVLAPAGLLDSL
jgi:mono/diheme cytochrome c family protein